MPDQEPGRPMSPIRIGSRGSTLALAQTRLVADALAAARHGLTCEIVRITTTGDRLRDKPLPEIGGKGLFTKEIEDALLRGDIHLAVHSLKDLPTQLPEGLAIAAIPQRAPANDALISADAHTLDELPPGAQIGTSSPRRAAQLLAARPDLHPVPIRGNLDTRLRKLREGSYDGIVLALAGLTRLGMADQASQIIPFDVVLPAPGQGALAIETRAGDPAIAELVGLIDHPASAVATVAERAVLEAIGGGCSLPLGAYAELDGDALRLCAILLSLDGARACRAERTGPATHPAALARAVVADLRAAGADAILTHFRLVRHKHTS